MTVTLDPAMFNGWPKFQPWKCEKDEWEDAPEDGRPWKYIFCSNELPDFCRLLLEISMRDDRMLRNTALYVEIDPKIGNGATDLASSPAGLSRMRNAFGSLGHLHSFCAAQVDGPLSDNHKSEIIDTVCRERPTAMELIRHVLLSLKQADEKADGDHLRKAIVEYKTALSLIRSYCWRHDERHFVMHVVPFRGLAAW